MTARVPTFGEVNAAALAAFPGLLDRWFPNGTRQGHEFSVGNLQGEPGQSLHININTGIWKDFATGESGSDPVSLYAAIHGLGQAAAREELAAELGPVGYQRGRASGHREVSASRHRVPRQAPPNPDIEVKTAAARRVWAESRPATGTPVERYLATRGIMIEPLLTLRYHPALRHGPTGLLLPAMVAAVTVWPGHDVVAIHRTFLTADGSCKARVLNPKLMLGPCAGGAVRLAPALSELVLAEGIESALSVLQASEKPTWATLSTSGLKAVRLPPEVESVIIAADGDEPGLKAAEEAASRFYHERREVKIARPPAGMDFNDLLMLPDNVVPLRRRPEVPHG